MNMPPFRGLTERALRLALANQHNLPTWKIADREFIYYLREDRNNHISVRLLLIFDLGQAPFLSIYVQLLSIDIPNKIMMGDIDGSERCTLEFIPRVGTCGFNTTRIGMRRGNPVLIIQSAIHRISYQSTGKRKERKHLP